jgi:guanosine-3',5'-bis(diphosphate) 3'-pyrophosphohydrolase
MNASDDHQRLSSEPVRRILDAARFAAEKHAGQKRKGQAQEPYVNHVLEVAQLIAASDEALDVDLVVAGLLHDTIEDTPTTAEDLESLFGKDVASLVLEVTDDRSLPKQARKALQVKNAPKKTSRAQVIKLADKISNVRSVLSSPPADWSEERKRDYFEWSKRVVAGLRSPNPQLKAQFDQLCVEFEQSLGNSTINI